MTWLITGGAGYIGAHVVRAMTTANEHVVVLDDLSAGVADRLPADVPLVAGSSLDATLLKRVLSEHAVTGIVHLAARKQVGESVAEPPATTRRTSAVWPLFWTPPQAPGSSGSSSPPPPPSTAIPTWTSSRRTPPAPP